MKYIIRNRKGGDMLYIVRDREECDTTEEDKADDKFIEYFYETKKVN